MPDNKHELKVLMLDVDFGDLIDYLGDDSSAKSILLYIESLTNFRKIMHLNARRIYDQGNQTQLILLTIEDVTEREYYKKHLEELVEERTAEIRKLKEQLEAERAYLQEEIKLVYNHEDIVGKSDAINYVFFKVEQIAGAATEILKIRHI